MPTTACSPSLQGSVATEDAWVVSRLRRNGAVILGKTTTHEFALGGPDFQLPTPPARNPWNIEHFTGGSSSGSAATLAARLSIAAVGTDTVTSIRSPAALSGVVGMKPTFGRIGRSGILPLAESLDHVGPMTRCAADLEVLLGAMSGLDPNDRSSRAMAPGHRLLTNRLEGIRVGCSRKMIAEAESTPAVSRAFEDAIEVFTGLGASVVDIDAPGLYEFGDCGMVLMLAEALATHELALQQEHPALGNVLRDRLSVGSLLTATDYVHALRAQTDLRRRWSIATENVDITLTPTVPFTAPRINEVDVFATFVRPPITVTFNVTGDPALSTPCGFDNDGLPIGLQIAGADSEDHLLIDIAKAYESATGWLRHLPNRF